MFADDNEAFDFLIGEIDPDLAQCLVSIVEMRGAKAGTDFALEFMRQRPDWDEAEEIDAKLAAALSQGMRYVQANIADWFLAGEVSFLDGQLIATFTPATSRSAKQIRLEYNQMREFRGN